MNVSVPPVTAKELPASLASLEIADRTDLLDRWRDVIGTPPPKNLSAPFLRRALAFELQCQARGSPKARTLDDLGRIAAGSVSHASAGTRLRPGAKLVREWQGRTWTVEVIEGGFLMGGERYASLTALARKITGARWSGPRFFGLTGTMSGDEASDTNDGKTVTPARRRRAA